MSVTVAPTAMSYVRGRGSSFSPSTVDEHAVERSAKAKTRVKRTSGIVSLPLGSHFLSAQQRKPTE